MLNIDSLNFKYPNSERFILKDINLNIDAGEYVSVVGENGSGKSTLVKLILGLLKVQTGSINIQTDRIGYLPQKKENLTSFPITVFELLNSYRKILKIKNREVVDDSLNRVNLAFYKNRMVGDLSGGELQKLYIARALIGDPSLLILDELSTGIDVSGQKEIYSFLKKLNVESNLTVISVDHNLDAAIFNSTKIFHIKDGAGHLCSPSQYATEFFTPSFKVFTPVRR